MINKLFKVYNGKPGLISVDRVTTAYEWGHGFVSNRVAVLGDSGIASACTLYRMQNRSNHLVAVVLILSSQICRAI